MHLLRKMKFLTLKNSKSMYDNQIAETLTKTYGDEKFKIYCEMQVIRHKIANIELDRLNGSEDDSYESYFWKTNLDEITKNEKLKENL